jgi:hypothetical protein
MRRKRRIKIENIGEDNEVTRPRVKGIYEYYSNNGEYLGFIMEYRHETFMNWLFSPAGKSDLTFVPKTYPNFNDHGKRKIYLRNGNAYMDAANVLKGEGTDYKVVWDKHLFASAIMHVKRSAGGIIVVLVIIGVIAALAYAGYKMLNNTAPAIPSNNVTVTQPVGVQGIR